MGSITSSLSLFQPLRRPIYNVSIVTSYKQLGTDHSADLNATYLIDVTVASDTAFIGKFWGGPTAVVAENRIGFFDGFGGGQGVQGNRHVVEQDVEGASEVFFTRQ